MSLAQRSKRPRGKSLPKSVHSKPQAAPPHELPFEASDVDQFKFRVVQRDGRHFFKDVRFSLPNGKENEIRAVIDFFNGQYLELLTPEMIEAFLGHHPVAKRFEQLVADLQEVLCD